MYTRLLARLGLGHVSCAACARALLPAPFNWESYTYTATNGRSWTWDVASARAVVARRSTTERLTMEPNDVQAWLTGHAQVNEAHLAHIPLERVDEPVLLAEVPDGRGHVMIDGSHRATIRTRSGLAVDGFLLTPIESTLTIGTVPLAMQRIAAELHRQRLLPDKLRH